MVVKLLVFTPSEKLKNSLFTLMVALAIALLSGCANVIPPCGAKISPPSSELRNTGWELVRWNLPPNNQGEVSARPIPRGQNSNPIQIFFDAKGSMVSGSTGCNRFTAVLTEDSKGFTLESIAVTKKACPAQRMELENDFLYELKDYRNIVLNGDQLLMIGSNREVLSFMKLTQTTK
jgi:heat shock protein HslJ